jgi:hypothetical protein
LRVECKSEQADDGARDHGTHKGGGSSR